MARCYLIGNANGGGFDIRRFCLTRQSVDRSWGNHPRGGRHIKCRQTVGGRLPEPTHLNIEGTTAGQLQTHLVEREFGAPPGTKLRVPIVIFVFFKGCTIVKTLSITMFPNIKYMLCDDLPAYRTHGSRLMGLLLNTRWDCSTSVNRGAPRITLGTRRPLYSFEGHKASPFLCFTVYSCYFGAFVYVQVNAFISFYW